jgi:ribosomal protein S18 acetylase RimI-like enzyme
MTEILDATPEDLSQISELARSVWHASFIDMISNEQIEYMLSLAYTPEKMREDMQNREAKYLKLINGSQLLGFASFRPSNDSGFLLLDKLYVHPAHQRKGYGAELMNQVEEAAEEEGYEGIILAVSRFNKPAIRAYEKTGFEVLRTEVIDIGGGFTIEDHVMRKSLLKAD